MVGKEYMIKAGTQIAYVPDGVISWHGEGTEFGFVTGDDGNGCALCGYYNEDGTLRTWLCSEVTPKKNLVIMNSRPQIEVDNIIKALKG